MTPPTPIDRSLAAFRTLVLSVIPQAVYWIVHEYSVVDSDGATFSGRPTDAAFSPDLPTRVPYSPSLAGSSCVVPAGTLAYVGFANGDGGKPYLVRFGSGLPTSSTVDATGSVNVGASASKVLAGSATRWALGDGDVVTFNGFTGPIVWNAAGTPSGATPAPGQSNVKV